MSAVPGTIQLIGYEQRTFWRNPPAAVLMFALPIVLLLILGATISGAKATLLAGGLTFGTLMTCYSQPAFVVVQRRDAMFLKRLRATPLRVSRYLLVLISNAILLSAILIAILLIIGVFAEKAPAPPRWPALILLLLIGAVTFCSMGMAVSALVPNEDAAPAFVYGLALPMIFLGAFFHIKTDSAVGTVAGIFPTRHLTLALTRVLNPHGSGIGLGGSDVLVIGIWLVASLTIALLFFRWEPRH